MPQHEHLERLLSGDPERILPILESMLPADLAELLIELDDVKLEPVLTTLTPPLLALVLEELDFRDAERLLRLLPEQRAAEVINEMSSDDAADLLAAMRPDTREAVLSRLEEEDAEDVRELLSYDEESSGGIMATEFLAIRPEWTAVDALGAVRRDAREAETAYYIYVTDVSDKLVGVLSLRELVIADPQVIISDIMQTQLVSVKANEDQEIVASLVRRYDLIALPVVDNDGVIKGIVTADDVLDVVDEEATEDIERMNLLTPSETDYLDSSVIGLAKQRLMWLLVLMVSATFTGYIIRNFEDTLEQLVALAVFIPMLMDTAGNAGSQSSTLVIRGMALGEINLNDWSRVFSREMKVSSLVGLGLAVINFLRVLIIERYSAPIAAVVSVTLALTIIMAKVIGGLLPMVAKKLRLDPAIMAGPLITTIVDALALLVYFSIATAVL